MIDVANYCKTDTWDKHLLTFQYILIVPPRSARCMPRKVRQGNILGSQTGFHNSGEFLHPFTGNLHKESPGSEGQLKAQSETEQLAGSNDCNDCGLPSGKIIEDYDGNRNIFSISSGPLPACLAGLTSRLLEDKRWDNLPHFISFSNC